MRANPGGQIPPAEVVGRNDFISRLWRILERQSLVLVAERRIGKTCIIKKMMAESGDERTAVYRDLEGIGTPLEFVELVLRDVETYLSRFGRSAAKARKVYQQIAGAEISGVIRLPESVAPHWKMLLRKAVEDLVEQQEHPFVFFWDEVPYLLENIAAKGGEQQATELLDVLRELRQTHEGVRMVFTGSIGFQNVITSLKRSGYANAPTNDMYTLTVPPLERPDAQRLASLLLEGEDIPTRDRQATAQAIATAVDGIPHYIHHVVEDARQYGGAVDPAAVEEIVLKRLTDDHDTWDMEHYRKRIDTYYLPEEIPVVLAALDALAGSKGAISFDDLFEGVKAQMAIGDEEKVRDVLTLMRRDHYVHQHASGNYDFSFPLIKRWWKLHRGIAV